MTNCASRSTHRGRCTEGDAVAQHYTGMIFSWKNGPISVTISVKSNGQKFQAITSTDAPESHGIATGVPAQCTRAS